jgi:hypothetical protein
VSDLDDPVTPDALEAGQDHANIIRRPGDRLVRALQDFALDLRAKAPAMQP